MKDGASSRNYGALPWANPLTSPYWRMMIPPELWDVPKRAVDYPVSFQPLLGGTTDVQGFAVKRSGPVIIYGLTAMAFVSTVPPTLRWGSQETAGFPSRALIQITDTKRLYEWFSAPIPLENLFSGSGSDNTCIPYIAEAGTVINVSLTSQNLINVGEDWNWFLNFRCAEVLI